MKPLHWISYQLYYRYFFLRDGGVARAIESLVGGHSVPSRESWEAQYREGYWSRLNLGGEHGHYAVILSYAIQLRPDASVLDVGCGEGILWRLLKQFGYGRYAGIDISETAIRKCKSFAEEKTSFVACDAEDYVPDTTFDLIIFNESLYYFRDPMNALKRYARYLAPKGIFVISLFDFIRTRAIRRRVKEVFSLLDETVVSNSHGTWHCLALAPCCQGPEVFTTGIGQLTQSSVSAED